ncbi:MaoC/PaaZ C-terminal domain-containing protein [Methylocystis sp. IM3]|uniref:MaoC/PaaZ C-terminal domain-containing protein n=1 Tax=unclassified Methylocystis TaxID=2625913 RepID=UPI000FB0F5AE|nr:MAG: dehydratase [Hyphomicrobiales bacterium]
MSKTIYFEDLHVGMRFVSEPEEIGETEIIAFARENDPQYFHTDPQAARDSMFGGLIASGWQTAASTVRHLLYRCGVTFAGGAVGVDTRISWKRPVRPGDRLHIEGEITHLRVSRSLPDRGLVSFEGRTCDSAGRVVQIMEATMLVWRDPRRAGSPEAVSHAS